MRVEKVEEEYGIYNNKIFNKMMMIIDRRLSVEVASVRNAGLGVNSDDFNEKDFFYHF